MAPAEQKAVIGEAGLSGTIIRSDQTMPDGGAGVLVRLDSGQHVLVPSSLLVERDDGSYYLPLSRQDLDQQSSDPASSSSRHLSVPIVEEQLEVQKRRIETGRVRVHTHISERTETVDEPLLREEVQIERVEINQPVNQADRRAEPHYEDDVLVIPLLEEIVVIEKRLMLREEIRIRKQRSAQHQPQQVTLQRTEVSIERIDAPE